MMELIVENEGNGLHVIDNLGLQGLFSTHKASIQPNILLRTAVFSPVGRKTKNSIEGKDLSKELRDLQVCKQEGYEYISIQGPKLNIETDFRVWCGVILAFSKYGLTSNKISMNFTEFAKFCGYPSKRFNTELREQIDKSLKRLRGQVLDFKSKNGDNSLITGLLNRAVYNTKDDTLELSADESLWDLYQIDRQVLVSMTVISKLPRAEVAQCLYLYFLSLPANPYPISFSRLRNRLQLSTSAKEANRRIKIGIEKLEAIGFISGSFIRKGNESYYIMDKKNHKLLM